MLSKLQPFLILTRPLNLVLVALAIAVGALVTGKSGPLPMISLACISGGFMMAGGNVLNDYFDIEIDRVNKPFRPLPSGAISPRVAVVFAIILLALAVFLSIFINFGALCIATLTALGLFVYSATLKRRILIGNLAVSLFTALAFVYGAIAVHTWQSAVIPAGFAFLFHLGREIIKDVEDQAADASCFLQTLPIRYGQRVAFTVVTLVFLLLVLLTLVPFIMDIYGKRYLWTVLVGVDLVLAAALVMMWKRPEPVSLRWISAALKLDMFVGLFAIYLGQSQAVPA